jgi:hypothetical protein
MYPMPGKCPSCGAELTVTRLHCRTCDLTVEGHFELGRFQRLNADQLRFLEAFVGCDGRLNKVQEELGLSYPTVRSRLNDVVRAMGYPVPEEPAPSAEQRKAILDDLSHGRLTSDEAVRLLQGQKVTSTTPGAPPTTSAGDAQ